jgi:hypothetical protein
MMPWVFPFSSIHRSRRLHSFPVCTSSSRGTCGSATCILRSGGRIAAGVVRCRYAGGSGTEPPIRDGPFRGAQTPEATAGRACRCAATGFCDYWSEAFLALTGGHATAHDTLDFIAAASQSSGQIPAWCLQLHTSISTDVTRRRSRKLRRAQEGHTVRLTGSSSASLGHESVLPIASAGKTCPKPTTAEQHRGHPTLVEHHAGASVYRRLLKSNPSGGGWAGSARSFQP